METSVPPDALPDWPLFGLADDVRPAMAQSLAAGEAFALVTLTRVEGGAPRGPGAQMLVGETPRLSGFLSGGCVEGDVIAHARAAMAEQAPRRLIYGEGGPPDIRLVCGGRIDLLVESVTADDPAARRLLALTQARQPGLWVSDGATRACLQPGEAVDGLNEPLRRALRDRSAAPAALTVSGPVIVRAYSPAPRLLVVGGDPTALALASLGAQMDYETWLIRPKGPEAGPPLAAVRYLRGEASAALAEVGLDAWSHVAVCTHDLETDEAALVTALNSDAAYVGVLGARRRLPERLARLARAGVSDTSIRRLKAPIGLDLGGGGAKAPWEIAVAVMAEITAERTRASQAIQA